MSNNLLAMLGFTQDVGGLIPQRHDLQVLFREIIEDVSIGTDYRWFLLSFFLKTLDDVDARSDRLGRIPRLFPHIGTDPLSSRLVREFFEDKGDLFSKLWRVSSSHYRESMARYVFKVGKWRKSPQLDDMAYLRDNSRTALASAATKWQGIAAFQPTDGELSAVYKELLDTNNTVSVRRIVELFENYSSAESEVAVHEMCNVADRVYARSLREARGRQFLFQLHVGLVSSPYVDALVSSLCLFSLVFECGIDSIRYHDAFPTCLMRKKEQGLFRQKSIVDGLVEQLAMDDNDVRPLLVLFNSIQWFPFAPFFASISVAMKESEENTSLTMVRDAMEGTISRADFAQYVNGKVQMHSG